MTAVKIIIILLILAALGIVIFPLINRSQFRKLPPDQQIRVLMKEANSLAYFKNISNGSTGVLYFVKNKRKIIEFPWELSNGKMLCTKSNPFDRWDYPEEKDLLSDDEISLLKEELEKFNKKNPVKIEFE